MRSLSSPRWEMYPPSDFEQLRRPVEPKVLLPCGATENQGLNSGWERISGLSISDLTTRGALPPIGEKIAISGCVRDEVGRPVPNTLLEIWQANAAGRYQHARDQWNAPLDPNFSGIGRVVTDSLGRYEFTTIRPGCYPWGKGLSSWRPAHIHLSLMGPTFASRLVTQFYFPGDPLLEIDPVANAVPVEARDLLVARFDPSLARAGVGLGYRFDIVLRGRRATPVESADE